jgi:hypothetical protein
MNQGYHTIKRKGSTVDQIVDKVIDVARQFPQASKDLVKQIAQDELNK